MNLTDGTVDVDHEALHHPAQHQPATHACECFCNRAVELAHMTKGEGPQ